MRLVLVRHGQTTWNALGRIQGKTNTPLTEKGKLQAQQISQMLSVEKPAKIFSSTLSRAINTAKTIAKKHDIKVQKRKELEEINYGIFEGKTFQEIETDQVLGKMWQERKKNKYYFLPPQGESFAQMNEKRIKPFIKKIIEKFFGKTVIIVAHSGTNRLIAGNCLSLPAEKMVNIWQPNECVYFIDCDEKKCQYSYQKIGEKKTMLGYLTTDDIKNWEEQFQ